MKKITGMVLKVFAGLVLLILILLFTLPVLFKDKIRVKVEKVINESVNAEVRFSDYHLGFFRNFPNLSFSLNNLSVTGKGRFEGDTLAGFRSFDLVFNLASLLKKSGYEVKSIILDRAVINALVLEDGSANWDIIKDTATTGEIEEAEDTTASSFKVKLKKFAIVNTAVSYVDKSTGMTASLKGLDFDLKGNMSADETDMQMMLNISEVNFVMDNVRYLNRAVVDSRIGIAADLDNMKFTLGENYFSLNELRLNFSGIISMPGDDIETDISFGTGRTSFKTLLSLVPAVYMKDFKELKTSGEFSLTGSAKGIYSEADSTLPDISLSLAVNNGLISYPLLPEKISNINLKSEVSVNGKDIDKTTVNIDLFHMELAGNPFDMRFYLKTPVSDPDFTGSLSGKIDLDALSRAIPMDSISLSGMIDMSVMLAGQLSMIEKEQYDRFKASGRIGIQNMKLSMAGYPDLEIINAGFDISPARAAMTGTSLKVGSKSDLSLSGLLENYIPYLFNEGTIKGNLSLASRKLDLSDIMAKMPTDTAATEDTASLSVIQVPTNIDFDFSASIDSFLYDNIKASSVKGHVIVRDGTMSVRETGLNMLGGVITMNADYDTRDSLKPGVKAGFDIKNIGVKGAFTTFNAIQKLAPAAKGIDGSVNLQFNYESLLGSDMMPVINTISGGGKLQSSEITLVESASFNKIKEALKLGDKFSNTFKDLNISFRVKDGRIYVSPFDIKAGNIKMNVSGDQGIDQTLNYLVKTEIPMADLGSSVNSLIDNLSSQAASFGVAFKPSDVIKVNVKVTGVFGKPVVTPVFGGSPGDGSPGIRESAIGSAKQVVGNAVDAGRDKLHEEAEAQGNRIVAEAEARGQQLRDEASRAAEKLKQEAEVQAQKLVNEASSKGVLAKAAAQKGADTIRKTAARKAESLIQEADNQANKLVEEAKARKQALVDKI